MHAENAARRGDGACIGDAGRRTTEVIMDGFLCVDKPPGPSSFLIARAVKKSLKVQKTGHAGTLDPMASGLLVVALGKCTRLLQYLDLEPKVYEFSVIFGKSTDTLDAEGEVTAENDVLPSEDLLTDVLKNFRGTIEQIPPAYSAIKINGARAYDLARKGADAEMKPRAVNIYSVNLCGYDKDERRADFAVSCSAGTYVRSLARDIAQTAGALGFVNKLRRTRTGRFDVSMAVGFESLKSSDFASDDARNYIINANDAFDDDDKVIITDKQKSDISYGRKVLIDRGGSNDVLIAFDETGSLSAVLKRVDGNRYHPENVFCC
jgi:tRNA pseudouridine55 synthase